METLDGEQQEQKPLLALGHKLFLLTHPDVDDIEKVRLRDEALASIKSDRMDISSTFPTNSYPHLRFLFFALT